jgi:copper transport protein
MTATSDHTPASAQPKEGPSPRRNTGAAARLLRRLATGTVAAAALTLAGAGAGTASAHPTLLVTDPAGQSAVDTSPALITLVFNEPVTFGRAAIVLLDASGRPVPVVSASSQRDGKAVTTRPQRPLPPGTYSVRWRVTGSDGDEVEQEFRFAVGTSLTGGTATGGKTTPAWGTAALRWLLLAGLAVAIGTLIAQRATVTAREEQPALPALRSWAPAGVALALGAVVGLLIQRVVDVGNLAAAWQGRAGIVLLVQGTGLLAAAATIRFGRWALPPLLVVVAAEGIRSHAGISHGAWGAALTGIHLAAATVWVGALVHTTRAVVAWRRAGAAVRWVLTRYMRLALWTYLLVVTAGILTALALVPLSQLFSTAYGRLLLIKVGLVVAASLTALAGRLVQRDDRRIPLLGNVMRVEAGLLAVVLVATAILISTPPPSGSAQTATPPPQPRGLVLPLGTLVGQIGVIANASDGLLVVRLSAPRRGDYYTPQPDQAYDLSTSVGDRPLRLNGCGAGCYWAPANWRPGDNPLLLRANAPGWAGGTTGMLVSWPPRSAAAELAAAVSATRNAGQLAVYEAVTSDTSRLGPDPARLGMGADFFVSQEPYSDGTAPIAVLTSSEEQPVHLLLGYPAASVTVQLTLDEQGRITGETLTDPTHLVTRRLAYPHGE